MKRIVGCGASIFLFFPTALCAAQTASMDWPQVIANLTRERTQALACVGLIKSDGDQIEIDSAKMTYGSAKADMDGVVAGLTTVLVEGGKPDSLRTVRASLETSGASLKEICAAAVKSAPAGPNTKGVWEDIAKGVVEGTEPIIKAISEGIGALWKRHVEKDQLVVVTMKTQLEAARWPEFGDIAAK